MNKKIIIIAVIITISISIIYGISEIQTDGKKISEQSMNEKNNFQPSTNKEIQAKYDKLEQDRIDNLESDQPFIPAKRDWPSSGPFQIDRSVYLLGEKIFVNIDTLTFSDKGEMKFLRPLNDTHYKLYYSMVFDGSKDRNNFYFTPDLSELRGICDKTEFIGTWKIIFDGTNYPELKFKIIDRILPGQEDRYENVC